MQTLSPVEVTAAPPVTEKVSNAFRAQFSQAQNPAWYKVDRDFLVKFTADEAVKVFVENYQKEKLTVSKAPLFVLKIAGLFNQKMNYTAKIIEALNNYKEEFTSEKGQRFIKAWSKFLSECRERS